MKRVRIDPHQPNHEVISETVKTLAVGGVVIYPSDTCYGIGAEATNQSARETILRMKGRTDIGLSVIIPGLETISRWADVSSQNRAIIQKYLPGSLSFFLPNRNRQLVDLPKISIRYPAYPFLQHIAHELDRPFSTTSANRSGEPPSHSSAELETFLAQLPGDLLPDLVIDGGDLPANPPSTLVDLTVYPPKVVRQGASLFHG